MSSTTIRLPRISEDTDILDTFGEFHDTIRDVAAWAPTILDERGFASPRDARWLRAFLLGPLAWHQHDEEETLDPERWPRRSPWLELCLEHAREKHGRLNESVRDLVTVLDLLATGEPAPPSRFRAAVRAFVAAADDALHYEDDIILPTTRLYLGPADRAALKKTIAALDDTRPWAEALVAFDAAELHQIHSTRVLKDDGSIERLPFAACPRRRSASITTCRACPHLEEMRMDANGGGFVACAIDDTRAPTGRSIMDIMTRDVVCVARHTALTDAIRVLARASITGVPVVDEDGHPVGVLSQSDIIGVLAGEPNNRAPRVDDVMMHVAFVVRETDDIETAARLLVAERVHRLPVINHESRVVGIVSTLDVLRAQLAAADAASA